MSKKTSPKKAPIASPKPQKQYYFISGLPRSGSTLLSNILAQNPRFQTGSTSGIMDIIFTVKNIWDKLIEFQATPNNEGKKRVLKGILESFYADSEKPVVFDKCRGWLAYLEMAEAIVGKKVKVLVPVRDIRDILSSFEKLHRKASATKQIASEATQYFKSQTTQGRAEILLDGGQPVGLACNRIEDAIQRGFRDRMHFVSFDELTTSPDKAMAEIYAFLGEKPFKHDFNNVEQVNKEDDRIFGYDRLHITRRKVEPVVSDWQRIIGLSIKDIIKEFI